MLNYIYYNYYLSTIIKFDSSYLLLNFNLYINLYYNKIDIDRYNFYMIINNESVN